MIKINLSKIGRLNMIVKKRKILLLATLISFGIIINSVSAVGASSTNQSVIGTINDAFYGDLDYANDTLDIQYNINIYVNDFSTSNAKYGLYLTLLVGLEYPSGLTYWYRVDILSYKQSFNLKIIFYDSVLEGGWYTAHLYSFTTYGNDAPNYDSLIFDPPSAGVTGVLPA